MSRALPRRPHLDSLHKQARQLFRAHRSADPEAVQRIRSCIPRLRHASDAAILQEPFRFQSAQCVLAREYGFSNWSKLVQAVDIVRQAETAMLADVDDGLKRGQPIHVLVPEYLADEVAERLSQHCGAQRPLRVHRTERVDNEALIADLTAASVVVSSPDALAFPVMYERLYSPEDLHPLTRLLGQAHAFVNVRRRDERTPLIISGPNSETGEVRDLASMFLTEFYGLYGSMADHRY